MKRKLGGISGRLMANKAKDLKSQWRRVELKNRLKLHKVPLIRRLGVISQPSIRLSEQQLLSQLGKQFPIRKSYLYIFELVIDHPRLDIHAIDDRFNMGFDIKIHMREAQTKVFHGKIDLSMGVDFDSDRGVVYLTDPELHSFTIKGLAESLTITVGKLINDILLVKLDRLQVYRLESASKSERALKKILKDIQLGEGELILSLGFQA